MSTFKSLQTYDQVQNIPELKTDKYYRELMSASADKDSLYIRAKESLTEYFNSEDCRLSPREKAEMLVKLVSEMAIQMSNASLSAAVKVAESNRDAAYMLTKLREDTLLTQEQRDKVAAENENIGKEKDILEAQRDKLVIDGWKVQTSMIREDGMLRDNMPSIESVVLPSTATSDQGMRWEQEQQTKASVYATFAKSFRESGVVSWTTSPADGKIDSIIDVYPEEPGLTRAQELVAIRQQKGFDDNMRQHAANSSANMIGLLLSASQESAIKAEDVEKWRSAVDYLNSGGVSPAGGSIDITTPVDDISVANGATLSGTTENIPAGTQIRCEVIDTDGNSTDDIIDIVQMDGSWDVVILGSDMTGRTTGAGNVSVTVQDGTGAFRTDLEAITIVA